MSETLSDYESALAAVAYLALPTFAEWSIVDVLARQPEMLDLIDVATAAVPSLQKPFSPATLTGLSWMLRDSRAAECVPPARLIAGSWQEP